MPKMIELRKFKMLEISKRKFIKKKVFQPVFKKGFTFWENRKEEK